MNAVKVTVVRIYLKDPQAIEAILRRLHDEEKIRGVTIFEGYVGFGETNGLSPTLHISQNVLQAPMVIEFFDEPSKVAAVIKHIAGDIKPHHMMWWDAQVNAVHGSSTEK